MTDPEDEALDDIAGFFRGLKFALPLSLCLWTAILWLILA